MPDHRNPQQRPRPNLTSPTARPPRIGTCTKCGGDARYVSGARYSIWMHVDGEKDRDHDPNTYIDLGSVRDG